MSRPSFSFGEKQSGINYRGFKKSIILRNQDSIETPKTPIALESYGHEDVNDMLSLSFN